MTAGCVIAGAKDLEGHSRLNKSRPGSRSPGRRSSTPLAPLQPISSKPATAPAALGGAPTQSRSPFADALLDAYGVMPGRVFRATYVLGRPRPTPPPSRGSVVGDRIQAPLSLKELQQVITRPRPTPGTAETPEPQVLAPVATGACPSRSGSRSRKRREAERLGSAEPARPSSAPSNFFRKEQPPAREPCGLGVPRAPKRDFRLGRLRTKDPSPDEADDSDGWSVEMGSNRRSDEQQGQGSGAGHRGQRQHNPFVEYETREKRLQMERRWLQTDPLYLEMRTLTMKHDATMARLAMLNKNMEDRYEEVVYHGACSIQVRAKEAIRELKRARSGDLAGSMSGTGMTAGTSTPAGTTERRDGFEASSSPHRRRTVKLIQPQKAPEKPKRGGRQAPTASAKSLKWLQDSLKDSAYWDKPEEPKDAVYPEFALLLKDMRGGRR
mmetsp:Transcript_60595/g.131349  ORF Transcript_60595/g.131349 Transcript_60595/m.131349 type:complete len:439 (-) Transcript_60595:122-1438(-)